MLQRRRFLQMGSLGAGSLFSAKLFAGTAGTGKVPLVISTWDAGINANKGAWEVLKNGGTALDAVEKGVMVTEDEISCCVGLGANPDRDGHVTLDASIMDEKGNCGCVAFLERIKHPISVARKVMEKTPHVMLVGSGAQQFAISEGFQLEPDRLSPDAQKAYEEWLKKSEYKPQINVENTKNDQSFAPIKLPNGAWNHDTIGMLAIDAKGNLSGSCTTSGMGFKMRGRVGDSPIIGAGLFVDNEIGAAVSTGLGEEVIKVCGTHLVVEFMRQGNSPENACKLAVERIVKKNPARAKDFQVGFIAINKKGQYGGYCIQKGFNYAVCYSNNGSELVDGKYLL
ncbi:N(4)-(beta-N-acetylglucosaminyl)-L-asparaginase [Panacibacter sp. DH6]|uniref:N(4)-(Beta-N-acetylglucosaminyl)-L-asparaginase n=1 Tax=Panacibacter microcysteis TaxID=2793269 RepID=A0A931E5L8_9BACT|nr:N(4)-(beta-N-acetylglucosaminyl)-L-asparaginase [Panacibacter microcysteis]MBG9376607.1 N(4)-(beta-N-acetylglucosaminyl)-L-asparaginase [Panacibacter microcysteis]